MKYPKLWDGPSPVGEALVRALQRTDAPYLSASTPDGVFASKSGQFQEVRGGEDYIFGSVGTLVRDGVEDRHLRSAKSLLTPFIKHPFFSGSYFGRGRVVSTAVRSPSFQTDTFSYPIDSSSPGLYEWRRWRHTTDAAYGRVFGLSRLPAQVSFFQDDVLPMSVGTSYFATSPSIVPLRYTEEGVRAFVCANTYDLYTDVAGAPVATPIYSVVNLPDWDGPTFLFPPNLLSNPLRRNHERPICMPAGGGRIYVLVVSQWTYPASSEEPQSPPTARLFYSQNEGSSWQIANISALYFKWSPVVNHRRNPIVYGEDWFRSLNLAFTTRNFVQLDQNEVLFTYVFHFASPSQPNFSLNFATRMLRFKDGTATILNESGDPNLPLVYYQSIVYLGGNNLLAKRVRGFNGMNFDVEFAVSFDRGVSWGEVPAFGLPINTDGRKNRAFGNLKVLEYKEGETPLVAITAYDEVEKSYFVYTSSDGGLEWRRRSRIGRTDEFRRVDTMVASDSGPNFNNLIFFGTPARPAPHNVVIPDFLD